MSMPSFDFFKSGPATEVLRIESEPPGADARTFRDALALVVDMDARIAQTAAA